MKCPTCKVEHHLFHKSKDGYRIAVCGHPYHPTVNVPIGTNYDFPPIPIRNCDWSAWYCGEEDYDMHVVSAPSRVEAIRDLIENYDPIE